MATVYRDFSVPLEQKRRDQSVLEVYESAEMPSQTNPIRRYTTHHTCLNIADWLRSLFSLILLLWSLELCVEDGFRPKVSLLAPSQISL